jgi:hypothetical protein
VHLPGLAAFRFDPAGDLVTAFPAVEASRSEVVDAYRRAVLPIIQQRRAHQVLHASGVRAAEGVVAFCGMSGTGKSTLAYGFAHRGYPLWGDDAVCFTAAERQIESIPLPFDVLLRPAAASHFDVPAPEPGVREASADAETTAPSPLSAVCVLEKDATSRAAAVVTRLSAADAFTAVLQHAYASGLEDVDRRDILVREYLQFVATTPVFHVRFRRGFEHLDEVVQTIELRLGLEPPTL